MLFQTAALLFGIRLVTAVPSPHILNGELPRQVSFSSRFDGQAPQGFGTQVSGANNPKHSIGEPSILVHIALSQKAPSNLEAPEVSAMREQIPGWLYLAGKKIQGRIHGNTFWNIKGELEEEFPIEEFLFDPLVFTLNHPTDFEGAFTGTIGRGQVELKWASGATIVGRSGIGDYTIKGKTAIDWSP